MTIYRILGLLSPLIAAMGYVPYVFSMIKGKTQPHPFSWLLWSLLGGAVLFLYYSAGARDTLPLAILNCFGPVVIFIFSLKYWQGSFSGFDYLCLALSFTAVIFYIIYHNAGVSLSIALSADLLAFFPTYRKSYFDPESENSLTWLLFVLGNLLSVFAISQWTYSIALFPVYLTIANSIGLFILVIRRKTLKKA